METNTHFIFDDEKILISPNLRLVVNFLMDIEKEIESILGFNKKLDGIRESYMEMIGFVSFLSEKLKENHVDFEYKFKEHPEKIGDKLQFYFPLRSMIIVLFASLEVLFTLHTAYTLQTTDEDELRKATMNSNTTKKFLNNFILTKENLYYANNLARFSKIDSLKLRDLRNSLTHFFSIGNGGLSLAPHLLDEKSRKFENFLKRNKRGNIIFMSENDLFNLIKEANLIQFRKWSSDFKNNPCSFKQKMECVIDLVTRNSAVILSPKDSPVS